MTNKVWVICYEEWDNKANYIRGGVESVSPYQKEAKELLSLLKKQGEKDKDATLYQELAETYRSYYLDEMEI